jgi:N-acetylglutamate synthase-like GNAT family acetyltransferase
MSPQVRIATVQDADEIARLCTLLGYTVSGDVMRGRLGHLLSSSIHSVLVADNGDTLLGWISGEARVTLETGERIEITGLVVDPVARVS